MVDLSRRDLLAGAIGFLAVPAIVRATSLMQVHAIPLVLRGPRTYHVGNETTVNLWGDDFIRGGDLRHLDIRAGDTVVFEDSVVGPAPIWMGFGPGATMHARLGARIIKG